MSTNDPLSLLNPKTVGYGKSGANPYKDDDKFDYHKGAQDMIAKIYATAHYSHPTLSKENLETIMGIISSIVGAKVDRYSPLNRYDEEHFRHQLEEAFRHNKLTRNDINDAWKIWENFKQK
jgi:hypothetical protein